MTVLTKTIHIHETFVLISLVYEMCDQVNTVHEFILLREALVQETEEMPVLLPWPACKLALPC